MFTGRARGRFTMGLADGALATEDLGLVRAVLLAATGAGPDADSADLLPTVELVVHHYAGPDREGVVRVPGHGPVTKEWVREVLGPRAWFTILPVLDLAGQASRGRLRDPTDRGGPCS